MRIVATLSAIGQTSQVRRSILIALFIVLPLLGAQLSIDLSFVSRMLAISTGAIIDAIVQFTGNS